MPKLREPPKRDDEEKPVPVTTAGQSELQPEQPEVTVAPQPDDNSEELKRQLETLRRSESTARQQAQQAAQQRDAAIRYAQEREVALSRSQKDASDSRLEAIQNGMAAAEAEVEEAKRAFRSAAIEQDIDAQVAAQERMAEAKANLVNLTNGKAAMERGIAEEKERIKNQPPPQQQQPQGDALDRTTLPQTAKNWLRSHPEYLTDSRKNAKIQSLHWDVLDEGHQPFTDKYYESLEVHLGLRAKPRQEAAEEDEGDEQPVRKSVVSAPVSREAPSSSGARTPGTVRLTAQQREMAKASGITEAEYAKQVVNLQQAKANGSYGGQP